MRSHKARFLALFAVCLLWGSLSHGAPAKPLTGNQVAQKALRGAVFIQGRNKASVPWTGSGFVVDRAQRLVVTNHHVTNNEPTVLVCFPAYHEGELIREKAHYQAPGRAIRGRVIDSDATLDLAVVQLDSLPEGVQALPLAATSPGDGERLHLVGNPSVSQAMWVYSTGHVRAVYRARKNFPPDGIQLAQTIHAWVVESNMSSNGGDSGAAVLNDRGEVVAVNSYTDNGTLIHRHIDQREVKYLLAEVRALMKPATATAANFYHRAERLRIRGRLDDATADYGRAIRLDPNFAAAYRDRGYAAYLKGSYDTAVADCTTAIRLDPKDPHGYNQRGLALVAKKAYDRAVADYTQAIQLRPQDHVFRCNRAAAYLGKDSYREAITDATESLRLDPDYQEAYMVRGQCHYWQKDYDRALADFERARRVALKHNTLSARIFHWLGGTLEAKEAYDMADLMYDQMIKLDGQAVNWLPTHSQRYLKLINKTNQTLKVCIQYETFTDRKEWQWFNADGKLAWTVKPGQVMSPTHDDWHIRARRIRVCVQIPGTNKWTPYEEFVLAPQAYRSANMRTFKLSL